jgi:ferrochelatase
MTDSVLDQPAPLGVLLSNIGSPAAPTAAALRPYLAQFLGDRRIIELPRWLWLPVLHGVILNTRPARSARLYQNIWTEEGAPLLVMSRRQAEGLRQRLAARSPVPVVVRLGMRYGSPSIAAGLRELWEAGARRVLVFPLFPQYSATTTASVFDAVFEELTRWRWLPELRTVGGYHRHPGYIAALADSLREHWAGHGAPGRLLFSFHGLPQSYAIKGDPYLNECRETARWVAEALSLKETEWAVSFQSRLGPVEWLRPYTDETLAQWGRAGVRDVHVVAPGFAADCLETLDELGRENKHIFESAGGVGYHYIPALNDRPQHLDMLADITLNHLQGWEAMPDPHRRLALTVAGPSAIATPSLAW